MTKLMFQNSPDDRVQDLLILNKNEVIVTILI